MFVKWLSEMYSSTYVRQLVCSSHERTISLILFLISPGVLRCLMGYIVDITIVLEVLFWFKIAQPRLPSICQEDIDAAFGLYRGSASHIEVHQKIRNYVDNMRLLDHVNPDDKTHIEVETLINAHRHDLIDKIFADTKRGNTPTISTEEVLEAPPNIPNHAESNSTRMDPPVLGQPHDVSTYTVYLERM